MVSLLMRTKTIPMNADSLPYPVSMNAKVDKSDLEQLNIACSVDACLASVHPETPLRKRSMA